MTPEKLDELEPTSFDLPMTPRQAWAGGYALGRYHAARREAALREALTDAQRFHDAWVARGILCLGTHPLGEGLCQNVTAVNLALLSEVP